MEIKIFKTSILCIFLIKIALAIYNVNYATKANFFTGAAGYYSIVSTLLSFVFLLIGTISLLIGKFRKGYGWGTVFMHLVLALLFIVALYAVGEFILDYSFHKNAGM